MITCPKCSKENQDHYKFCLGCGAELPRDAAPKPFAPRTPPHGMKAAQAGARVSAGPADPAAAQAPTAMAQQGFASPAARPSAGPAPAYGEPPPQVPQHYDAPPAPAVAQALARPSGGGVADGAITCPQCSHPNSAAFKFCASCGFNLASAVAPPQAPAPPPVAHAVVGPRLTALRADGSEAGTYDIQSDLITLGRELGAIFGGDNYLSPQHATFTRRGNRSFVKDVGSTNGTYIRLKRDTPEPIADGQMFRIGQEIVVFDVLNHEPPIEGVEIMGAPSAGYVGRISLVTGRDATGNAFPIPETGVHIGRERGHILFPEDGYVSGLHCSLVKQGETMMLTDLGSSNGTFVRLSAERELHDGDVLLMGQQLFRVSM